MKRLIWLACLCLCALSCRRQDLRTVILRVPAMKNAACEEIVRQAVHGVSGVDRRQTRIDRATRTVFVTYDSLMLSWKNMEFAVADAGFAANAVPANPRAAANLPPECR